MDEKVKALRTLENVKLDFKKMETAYTKDKNYIMAIIDEDKVSAIGVFEINDVMNLLNAILYKLSLDPKIDAQAIRMNVINTLSTPIKKPEMAVVKNDKKKDRKHIN